MSFGFWALSFEFWLGSVGFWVWVMCFGTLSFGF
jgi:hypothetical protein